MGDVGCYLIWKGWEGLWEKVTFEQRPREMMNKPWEYLEEENSKQREEEYSSKEGL